MKFKQKIIEWVKVQLGIHDLEHRINERVERAEDYIRERTVAHLDVHAHPNTPTQVVVIGRYQGGDYVRTFNILSESLSDVVPMLKNMERYASLGRVDHMKEISQFIKHDFERY